MRARSVDWLKKCSILIISVLVLFNIFSTKIYSIDNETKTVAKVGEITDSTYTDDGGKYSLAYILSNYNVFTFDEYRGTHVVGPMIVGGYAGRTTLNGDSSGSLAVGGLSNTAGNVKEYPHMVPSYFKGELKLSGSVITASDVPLYLGTINNISNKNWDMVGPNNSVYTKHYFTDKYVDFDKAKSQIKNEMKAFKEYSGLDNGFGNIVEKVAITQSLINSINKEIDANNSYVYEDKYCKIFYNNQNDIDQNDGIRGLTVQIKLGNNFHFESFKDIGCIIYEYETFDEKTTTIISTDDQEISKFPKIIKTKSDVMGNSQGGVYKDANNQDVAAYHFGNLEVGPSISVMYLCPNVNNIRILGGQGKLVGHLVAPEATVTIESGDYNGTVIANKVNSKAEGHMWPYVGIVNPGGLKIELDKFIDGKVITDPNQKFEFKLEQISGDSRAIISDSLKNNPMTVVTDENGKIKFKLSGFSFAGDYIFKITEINNETNKNKYICTPEAIYAKVVATKTEEDADGTITAALEGYYSDEACTKRLTKNSFNNITLMEMVMKKQWYDADGNIDHQEHGGITVNVYQKRYIDGIEKESKLYKTITLNKENNWQQVLTKLPKSDGDIGEYKYFINETSPGDYDVTYEINNEPSSKDNGVFIGDKEEVTIKNQRKQHQLVIKKVDQNDHNKLLADAMFNLYGSNDKLLKFVKKENGKYYYDETGTSDLITDSNGLLKIDLNSLESLNINEYLLKEVKAPAGYVIDFDEIKLKFHCSGECTYQIDDDEVQKFNDHGDHEIMIENVVPNVQVPETGGTKYDKWLLGAAFIIGGSSLGLINKFKTGAKKKW